jgi:uncharacterized protein DUF1761
MHINYLAVVVAAVLNMAVGALWYSPLLFAKQWLAATGKKDMGNPGPGYAITTLGSLVMALILAYVAGQVDATTFGAGVKIGLIAWAGFVATTYAANYVFEGRSLKLYAINTGYFLVTLVLMGGLLAAWH